MPFIKNIATLLLVLLTAAVLPTTADARSWRWSSNSAPVISGTAPTTATVGSVYKFQPTAADANGDKLTFSISNKPAWASFNTSTGLLSGTPTTVGTYASIVISVSDSKVKSSLAAFSITVTGSASSSSSSSTTNSAPTISGTPSTSVTVGSTYNFTPTATDANGDALGFSISNKPSWATFSTTNGKLTGTPVATNSGSYAGIDISVSDGKITTSLASFSITVVAATITNGTATLSWTPPTANTDGSTLTDLAGYTIYYGTSSSNLSSTVSVSNGLTSYVISNLSTGTWYFAITSVNTSSVESSLSGIASKTI